MILFNDPNCQGPSTPAAGPANDLPLQSRYRVASFKVANVSLSVQGSELYILTTADRGIPLDQSDFV